MIKKQNNVYDNQCVWWPVLHADIRREFFVIKCKFQSWWKDITRILVKSQMIWVAHERWRSCGLLQILTQQRNIGYIVDLQAD